jgi:hypothetical protein
MDVQVQILSTAPQQIHSKSLRKQGLFLYLLRGKPQSSVIFAQAVHTFEFVYLLS